MTESHQHQSSASPEPTIPSPLAEEIRKLSHDLSNALEVILQTNYLLGMAETEVTADQKKWREMLEQGVAQATNLNKQLREYIRAHC